MDDDEARTDLIGQLRSAPRGFWYLCIGVFMLGVGIRVVADASSTETSSADSDASVAGQVLGLLSAETEAARVIATYGGLGVWVDAFDFSPSYQGGGGSPALAPAVVDDFDRAGVQTIYLQAARSDDRAPGLLLEDELLGEFLVRAHAHDIAVVGWYLPTFADVDRDLDHLAALAEFEVLGHRFDGVAVDIEYIEAVPDVEERSRRLVELSRRLREQRGTEALGAVVPPAVQLEVINTSYWPRFPWRDLDVYYDVWLPMAYWTTRTVDSGYRDAYTYSEESTRRMRANLGRPDAVVHLIGGIGDATTAEDLEAFRRALDDTGAIGGSIYDWLSLPPGLRDAQADLLPAG